MTDYSGSWAKGFASTFAQAPSMILNTLEWKERKKAKKKIDDAVEELKLNSTELARRYDMARADGTITQQEYSDTVSWAMPLGNEILSRVETLYGNYRSLTSEKIDAELEDINAFYNLSKDVDFQNIEQMRAFGSRLTMPKAKIQWDIIIKSIESRQAQPAVEVFPTAGGVTEKYPEAGYEYSATAKGYVPTYQKPTTETAKPTDTQVKLAEVDKLTFLTEERRNAMKVNILAGGDSATTEKVNAIRAAGGTDADILEAFGAGVRGVNPPKPETETIPVPGTIENIREDILNAENPEDAVRIYDNYINKYGSAKGLGITDVKQFYCEENLKNYVSILKDITEGTPDNRNVKGKKEFTYTINGTDTTETGEYWYKAIYDSYVALLEYLEKEGYDTSQYKKLKSLSEIKKIKFGGFVGGGVETGDLISIYY